MRARGLRPCVLHRALRGDQQRRGAVGDLARHRGGEAAALRRSGCSVAIFSSEVSRRGPSSCVTPSSGTISRVEAALVDGAERALVALERERLHVVARDVPLLGDHLGAAELRHLLRAVARDPALRAGERIGEAERLAGDHRRRDRDHGSCSARRPRRRGRWCRSSPPARRSAPPAATSRTGGRSWCRARAPGSPAASQQVRAMSPACGPIVSTQPKTTSSTAAGSMPVRSTSAVSTCAPRSAGWTCDEPAAALADGRADGVDDVGLGHRQLSSRFERWSRADAARRPRARALRRGRGGSGARPRRRASAQARFIQRCRSYSDV